MFAKPNTGAWPPHHVPPADVLSKFNKWQICIWGIFPSCNSNREPGSPTSRALVTGAMDGDLARVEAKGRMTFPILAMRAVRTRRSCPQQGVEGDWQPSEEAGCGGEMLPSLRKSHGSSDWVTCQWKLITPFWCSVRTPSPCLSSMCRQDILSLRTAGWEGHGLGARPYFKPPPCHLPFVNLNIFLLFSSLKWA